VLINNAAKHKKHMFDQDLGAWTLVVIPQLKQSVRPSNASTEIRNIRDIQKLNCLDCY
jgi:hypothetical protein